MKSNKIYFGFGIVLLSLILILYIYYNSLIVTLHPENNSVITDIQPTFRWTGEANKLLIDDNEEFISPIIEDIKGNSYQIEDKLNFTTYYWKLIGKKESSVSQFRVDSVVAMDLKNQNELYNITNVGTADLNVEVVEEIPFSEITGGFVLRLNETRQFNVKNKT